MTHRSALVLVPDGDYDLDAIMRPHVEEYCLDHDDCDHHRGYWDWWQLGWGDEPAVRDPRDCAELQTYAVVTRDGWVEREIHNPDWDGEDYSTYMVDNPDFPRWRAEQLMAHRDGVAVLVDYHR